MTLAEFPSSQDGLGFSPSFPAHVVSWETNLLLNIVFF
jgi:hypothetical protein